MGKNGTVKEKNIIIGMVNYYLKVNIQMEKEMEKEKNITLIANYNLKVNIWMENDMAKEKNIIIGMVN